VDQLKPGTHGHNLLLKVVNCSVVVEKTRTDCTKIKIAEAVVGDQTGCITLTARNNQIDIVQPGQTIIARNAKVDMFRGFMRLAVDKWGKLERAPEPASFEVNTSNDLSTIEYELVTVHDNENA
jgi:replication factor A1